MTTLRAAAFAALGLVLSSVHGRAQTCRDTAYLGFDTRLTVTEVARLSLGPAPIVSFEVARGQPLVGQGTTLVTARGAEAAVTDLKFPLRSILVDDKQAVAVHAGDALYGFGSTAPALIRRAQGGRYYRSGTASMLEATQAATAAHFVLRDDAGRTLKLAALPGALRIASWNGEGLATVVGGSLFIWHPGDEELLRLANDEGLARVRDLVAVGRSRVVLAMSDTLVLLTPQGRLVIGAVRARVRWDDGVLYALDERSGVVWSLKGLGGVGIRSVDEAYARALIEALPVAAPASHTAFLEAARTLGCDTAEALRKKVDEAKQK